MSSPDIAIVVSTYQKSYHLRRVLASIAMQQGVDGRMEVVVADDGSTDDTQAVVEQFRSEVTFPVRFVTHPHRAFQLAKSRNQGFAATTAPYVVFLDGDCVIPPDHVKQQLRRRRRGVVRGGYCCRLDRETTERITVDAIRTGAYFQWIPRSQLRKLSILAWKSTFYALIRHSWKPRLFGGNIAIWREDYERVNGFDENFVGWGGEDDDLRTRLRSAGIKIRSILHWTRTYHLWHPPDPSAPQKVRDGVNIDYLYRRGRFTKCINGLVKRSLEDVSVRVVRPRGVSLSDKRLSPLRLCHPCEDNHPEMEIVCGPKAATFSGDADFNVLVVLEDVPAAATLASQAHLVIADHPYQGLDPRQMYPLDGLGRALSEAT